MNKYTAIDFIKEIKLYPEYQRISKIRNSGIEDVKRKEWVEKNREKMREYQRKYVEKHTELVKSRANENAKSYYAKNREFILEKAKDKRRAIRGLPIKNAKSTN